MADGELDSGVQELRSTLVDLIELLRRVGEDHWADWLRADGERIANADASGLRHLLAAFGGMGSLSDLEIGPLNGHQTDGLDLSEANGELKALRSAAYTLARELARELDLD